VFIPSGSTILDCILGGGWPLKKISNIIGDASTGKSQLAIEALINFKRKFPDGIAAYQECESGFDTDYAEKLGLNISDIDYIENVETVEGTMKSVFKFLARVEGSEQPGFYCIDTLDAIKLLEPEPGKKSNEPHLEQGYDKAKRANLINSMITSFAGPFKRANSHLQIISQVRQNIGVMFGDKYTVTGGKALHFYSSQRLILADLGEIKKTIDKIERVIGMKIKAKMKKCKIGKPRRTCQFPIIFDYGIDDVTSMVEWLKEMKRLNSFIDEYAEDYSVSELIHEIKSGNKVLGVTLRDEVINKWHEIEEKFAPEFLKY
jgi:recombination protein RecA